MDQDIIDTYRDKKIFVTGVAGFIGSNLAKRLLDLGAYVIGADDFFSGNRSTLTDVLGHKKFVFIEDDFSNIDLPQDLDYVFHLAVRNISVSEIDPAGSYAVNVLAARKLILKARILNNLKRFIFFSTSSIYGNSSIIPTGEEDIDPERLLCHYARHKDEVERQMIGSDIPYSVVRLTNSYGPGQTRENPYCGILGKWIFEALEGKPVEIIGDGEQTRDFIYIDDVIDACLLVAESPRTLGGTYNIATGKETSINSLAGIIKNIAIQRDMEVKTKKAVPRSIDYVRRRSLDIKKIKDATGWSPKVGLEEGVRMTFGWAIDFNYKARWAFKKIGISVPAYNEEKLITGTLNGIPSWVDFITVVNDCSTDNTSLIARAVKDIRVAVIDCEKNQGVGGAVIIAHKENIRRGADVLVVMAADGQMDPKYLTGLLDPIFFESYDYTKGNRFEHPEELKTMPKSRLIGNIIISILARITSGYRHIFDPLNGYTAITREMFSRLNLRHLSPRHDFELSLLIELNINRARVKDVSIPALYGEEKSKIVLRQMIPLTLFNLSKNFIRRVLKKWPSNT
jgi:nucleoside-diphosphate-sugar epimerase